MKPIAYIIGSLLWMGACMATNIPDDFELFQSVREIQPKVTSLTFCNRPQLTSLDPLKYFPNLRGLHIERCCNIRYLMPIIGSLTFLKSLELISQQLESIESLQTLKDLESLKLDYSLGELSVAPVGALRKLQSLHIVACPLARDWESIGNLLELRDLNLSTDFSLVEEDFPDEPWRVPHYPSLDFLKPLQNLAALNLSYCFRIKNLDPLWNLGNLEALSLLSVDANSTTDILGIEKLKKIKYLDVGYLVYDKLIQRALKKLPCLEVVYCDMPKEMNDILKKSVKVGVITNPGFPMPKYNWAERKFEK